MVLRHMYPLADIPTFQMSIDRTREPEGCFKLGKALRLLRAKGILVIGSGNITHNLGKMAADEAAAPEEWAEEFDVRVKNLLERGDLIALTQFGTWGKVAELSLPSHDHYLPLLFAAGLRQDDEPIKTVLEGFTFGTLSMRSVQFG
jgi:4,5-DOPA dioxygenase extradiol